VIDFLFTGRGLLLELNGKTFSQNFNNNPVSADRSVNQNKGEIQMSKKIFAMIAVVLLMVVGLTTVATADLPPYQGVLNSSTTVNWNGTGTVFSNTNFVGAGTAAFLTSGDLVQGSYTANSYTAYELGMEVDMLGTQMKATVANGISGFGVIDYTQTRTGPTALWYGADGTPGQVSTSYIAVQGGVGEIAMTTMTNGNGTMTENNYGGVKTVLSGAYQSNLAVDAADFVMNRQLTSSDGSYVQTNAYGSGKVYLEALSSSMSPTQATVVDYYSGFHAATEGSGIFTLTGSGENKVNKTLGFSTSGFTTWTPISGSDAGGIYNLGDTTAGSAYLGIQGQWGSGVGFDMSHTGMTAN